MVETHTSIESLIANAGNTLWKNNGGQGAAMRESRIANALDTIADSNGLEDWAV
jgi:hypothetical protein